MLISMTGYATLTRNYVLDGASGKKVDVQLNCEIKTINSRFFELTTKLPLIVQPLETQLSVLCKQQLLRGRAYLAITLNSEDFIGERVSISLASARQYHAAIQQLAKEFGLDASVKALDLLKMPGVINVEKGSLDLDLQKAVQDLVLSTLAELNKSRAVEGKALQNDLTARLQNCRTAITRVQAITTEVVKNLQAEVTALEMQSKERPEDAALTDKLVQMHHELDKSDMHEEIIRFSSHLEKCAELFVANQPEKGKQLDFFCQELSREINTVAAKSSNFNIIEQTVILKVELEKVKEQAQNIV